MSDDDGYNSDWTTDITDLKPNNCTSPICRSQVANIGDPAGKYAKRCLYHFLVTRPVAQKCYVMVSNYGCRLKGCECTKDLSELIKADSKMCITAVITAITAVISNYCRWCSNDSNYCFQ